MQEYKDGQTVIFNGYTDLQDGQEAILNAGERVIIRSYSSDNESYVVEAVDRADASGDAFADSVFPEELQSTGNPADEPQPKTKAKGKKAKGKDVVVESEPLPPLEAEDTDNAPLAEDPDESEIDRVVVEEEEEIIVPKKKGKGKKKAVVVADSRPMADQMIDETINEHQDAIAAARALIERTEQTYLMLGGVLHHIYENNLHKAEGYTGKRGFQEFVAKELGIEYRKAMYLMSNYRVFRELSLDEDRNAKLMAMGWSKAKEIAAIARLRDEDGNELGIAAVEENFDELAEYAVSNTRDDLTAKIKNQFVDMREAERITATSFKFRLIGEAGNIARRAIEHAKAQMPSEDADENAAFEVVCGEYLNTVEGTEQTLEDAIALVEARFGVRLVVAEGQETGAQASQAA